MGYLVSVVLAMLLGFLAGLLSFKVKARWCPVCGAVKSCPDCSARGSSLARQGLSGSMAGARRSRAAQPGRAATR